MFAEKINRLWRILLPLPLLVALIGCAADNPPLNAADLALQPVSAESEEYVIGAGDQLQIFVWRSPELSVTAPVRPDGRISTPLIEDIIAAGKSPTALADEIETALAEFVQEPVVTVIVTDFVGPYSRQIRVIGEATNPRAIPYRDNMSLLDVMIEVGGVTPFAAGNRAVLARNNAEIPVRLDALLKDGDLKANLPVRPGDVLIIPQSWF